MTRRNLTWLLAVLLAVPLLGLSAAAFIAGTDAGSRWLLRMAEPRLPAALKLESPSGNLLAGLRFGAVSWVDDGVDVRVESIEVNLELLPLLNRQLRLSRVSAGTVAVTVAEQADDAADEPFSAPQLPVELRLDSVSVDRVAVEAAGFAREVSDFVLAGSYANRRVVVDELGFDSDWLQLDLQGSLRLAGRFTLAANGGWRYQLPDSVELAGQVELAGNLDGYRVTHSLSEPYRVASSGTVRLSDPIDFDLVHRWEQIESSFGERTVVAMDGELRTAGNPADIGLSLDTRLGADELPEVHATLEGRTDGSRLEIDALVLESTAGRADVGGEIGWANDTVFDLAVLLAGIDPSRLPNGPAGALEADLTASGSLTGNGLAATFDVARLGGTLLDLPVSGSGRVSIDGNEARLADVTVALGSGTLKLDGRIADRLDLQAEAGVGRLAEFRPDLDGSLRATASVTGTLDAPASVFAATVESLRWQSASSAELEVSGELEPDQRLRLRATARQPVYAALAPERATLDFDGTAEEHRFSLSIAGSEGSANAAANGGLLDDGWSATIVDLSAETERFDDWALDGPVSVSVAPARIRVSDFCVRAQTSAGQFCGKVEVEDGIGSIDAQIRELPLAALPARWPTGIEVEGYLEAESEATLADGRLNGNLGASLVGTRFSTTIEDEPYSLELRDATVNAEVNDGQLRLQAGMRLDNNAGAVNATLLASNLLDPESPLNGDARLTLSDLSAIQLFVPDISEPTGRLDGTAQVTGTIGAPEINGEARLVDAGFGIRPAGVRVSSVDVRIEQGDEATLVFEGSACSGEGELRIDGSSRLGDNGRPQVSLALVGQNFELVRLPDWRIVASPDARVSIDESGTRISGALEVPGADITLRTVPETAARPSGDVTVHGERQSGNPDVRRVSVDVDVGLGDDVRLSGFGLTTAVEGDVRIRGANNRPYTGNGRLTLRDGRYKAYGQELEIESGELIFNGPLENPQLDVRAVRNIESDDVVAGINILGTPRQLRSEVYSRPPMRDAEALSYLLTGRALSAGTGDADLLNQAAFALGLSQAGSVTSRIRSELGLDTLTVDGGAESGRIVAGKRFGDRLLVEYGYGVIDKLGSLLLRYQLNRRLVLESRTGTVSELDLVYSVRKE